MDRADRDLELARRARRRSSRRGTGAAGGARRAWMRAWPDPTKRRPLGVRYLDELRLSSPAHRRRAGSGSGLRSAGDPRGCSRTDSDDRRPTTCRPTAPRRNARGSRRSISTPRLLHTLAELGYEEPTPIQTRGDPAAPRRQGPPGRGAHRHRQDGGVRPAVLNRLSAGSTSSRPGEPPTAGARRVGREGSRPRSLVLTPTRELAMQVAEAMHKYGRELGARVVPVYGGQPITAQLHRLARGSTSWSRRRAARWTTSSAGRSASTRSRPSCSTRPTRCSTWASPTTWRRILGSLPEVHQTALFSATISGPIARLAGRHLRHPVQVRVQSEATAGEASRVRQVAYVVRRADKLAALGRILDLEDGTATLVFARTRGEVDDLAEALSGRGRDAPRCTAASRRSSATGSWGASGTAPSTSSSPPTSPPAASTSSR